ncbi:MAG: hypothetical protein V4576_01965 [Patescibacteria group bacterium]
MGNFFKTLKDGCFQAQNGCGWTDIQPLVTGILKNLIAIGMFVAAFMVAYAGWTLFRGQGEPAARSKAKHILISVVIGSIILMGAYFIVDLILTKLQVSQEIRNISI